MILPNMLWAGQAHYPSDVLPRSATFAKYGDQIEQCVAAAKKYGLEVHVWKVNFNLAGAPREFVEKLRRQGRTQVTVDGRATGLALPVAPGESAAGVGEHVGSRPQVSRRRPALRLHSLSGPALVLLRRLPPAV